MPPQGMAQSGDSGPGQGGMLGAMDLNTLAQKIIKANPGIEQNPGHLMAALQQAIPLMNAQSKMELAQMQQQYRIQQADTARGRLEETQRNNERLDKSRSETRDLKKDLASEHEERMRTQFDSTQERLKNNAQNRYNESHARLERMISRDMTSDQKYAAAKDIDLAKQELTTQHRAILEQIQANNMLNAGDRDRLLKEAVTNRDQQLGKLEALRDKLRTNSSPSAAVKDKAQGQAPAGDPLQKAIQPDSALPPQAVQSLKEGQVTTFGNGQKWTLEGGKPKKVE